MMNRVVLGMVSRVHDTRMIELFSAASHLGPEIRLSTPGGSRILFNYTCWVLDVYLPVSTELGRSH